MYPHLLLSHHQLLLVDHSPDHTIIVTVAVSHMCWKRIAIITHHVIKSVSAVEIRIRGISHYSCHRINCHCSICMDHCPESYPLLLDQYCLMDHLDHHHSLRHRLSTGVSSSVLLHHQSCNRWIIHRINSNCYCCCITLGWKWITIITYHIVKHVSAVEIRIRCIGNLSRHRIDCHRSI